MMCMDLIMRYKIISVFSFKFSFTYFSVQIYEIINQKSRKVLSPEFLISSYNRLTIDH